LSTRFTLAARRSVPGFTRAADGVRRGVGRRCNIDEDVAVDSATSQFGRVTPPAPVEPNDDAGAAAAPLRLARFLVRSRRCGDALTGLAVNLGTHYPCSRAVNTGVKNDVCVHGPCSRPVNTVREHGCQKMTPVFSGRVGHQCSAGVNTGRVHGCPKGRVFTDRVHGLFTAREHGP